MSNVLNYCIMGYLIPTPGIFLQPDEVFMIERLLESVDLNCLSDEDRKFHHDLLRDLRKASLSFTPGML